MEKNLFPYAYFLFLHQQECIDYIIVHMYSTCNIRSVLFLPGYDDPILGNVKAYFPPVIFPLFLSEQISEMCVFSWSQK